MNTSEVIKPALLVKWINVLEETSRNIRFGKGFYLKHFGHGETLDFVVLLLAIFFLFTLCRAF